MVVFLVLTLSCVSECAVDSAIKKSFHENIELLKDVSRDGIDPNHTTEMVKASSWSLDSLTGHRANLSFDYTVTYDSKRFEGDLLIWNAWYKKNKCNLKVSK